MDWDLLLSDARVHRNRPRADATRSPFQQDADLIVFSAAFRRLQDKTQVHPLSEEGRVRTRLTHSIEVASVGRSLGSAVAHALRARRGFDAERCHTVASVVHAACLAHDIGNPPFGHGGEETIQAWFRSQPQLLRALSSAEAEDLRCFAGNAQGFRILTQLENYRFDGGLRLTHATLGAFMKYVVTAGDRGEDSEHVARRKPGFFESERAYVAEIEARRRLPPGTRHPLAYLTEAADDICYAIVDLEDGYDAGLVDHRDASDLLGAIAGVAADPALGRAEQLQKLRGIAIHRMVDAVAERFVAIEAELLRGEPCPELCAATALGAPLHEAKLLAARRIFSAPEVVERLLGGQRALCTLLAELTNVVEELERVGFERDGLHGRTASLAHLLGDGFRPRDRYAALLGVLDFISGLTDRRVMALSRSIGGAD
jgi:dGTPase